VGLVQLRCHYCSRWRPPWRVHQLGGDGLDAAQTICDHCLEWHHTAIEFLAGRRLPGCQNCGMTAEALRELLNSGDGTVEVRLYVLPKDGVYQVLCAACVRPYMGKRADLYHGTPFGSNILKL
jgi:hypothetical protein